MQKAIDVIGDATQNSINAAAKIAEETVTSLVDAVNSNSLKWEDLLEEYEESVNEYLACLKKVNSGDLSAAADLADILDDIQDLSKEISEISANMTESQAARYSQMMQKLANAMSNM
ncbi:MAG: hypothetical protein IKA70_06315 [Alistipes sp.]|nr:hypothetical protein [Alistipes sp.]